MKDDVVQFFSGAVAAVSGHLTEYLQQIDPYIQGVRFEHGHPVEIVQTLANLDYNQDLRYSRLPMVMLFQDLDEVDESQPGVLCRVRPTLAIVTGTNPEYVAAQRLQKTFHPILYPIYNALISHMAASGQVMGYGLPRHTKTDRLYWGSKYAERNSDRNQTNDFLDGIELKFDLKFYKPNCNDEKISFCGGTRPLCGFGR